MMNALYARIQTRISGEMAGDRGTTVVEFGLMGALTAMVIVASFTLLGDNFGGLFESRP